MRRYVQFLFLLILSCTALALTACRDSGNDPEPESAVSVIPIESLEPQDDSSGNASLPSEIPAPSKNSPFPADTDALEPEVAEAYRSALIALLEQHVFPDGTDCGFDDQMDPAGNQFAIWDIDSDGRKELIVMYTTTFTAGQIARVYDYDGAARQLHCQLSEYPLLTFYQSGVIQAGWSHNQTKSIDFWPYTLYQYDAPSDTYQLVGSVEAWEKAFVKTDEQGVSFPDEVDTSGTGVVYFITGSGESMQSTTPVDASAYEAWIGEKLAVAAKVDIPFTPLTSENISSIS